MDSEIKRMLDAAKRNYEILPDWWGTPIHPDDLVQLRGDHPHAGRIGTYRGIDYLEAVQRFAPMVEFDDGDGCYVFHADEWERA